VDKEYALVMLDERITELRMRYKLLLQSKDDKGREIAEATAATYRNAVKRDLSLCCLISELLRVNPYKVIDLSIEASYGLDKLTEPIERHRRLKSA